MVLSNRNLVEEFEGIAYIRQSDEREDKEDISEQTQLNKIKAYCEYNNIKLVKVFSDIDYSGFRIPYTKRPNLMNALDYLKNNGSVKKLIIYNLSRLTRRKRDFNLILSTLETINVDVCSAMEQLDFGSATGRLFTSMMVDFNEFYSDNLSDVTNENKLTNAEKGRWNGGPAPFGMIRIKDGFIEDKDNSWIIKKIFSLAIVGKGTFIISNYLIDHEIKTQTGENWSPRRVRYVLKNSTYAGMQRWKGKYYPLKNCETLIKWEDFLYIQSTLFGKEKVWRGKERQLLSSTLRCPICGSKMHARYTNTRKETRIYVCSKKNNIGRCNSVNYEVHSFNDAVINLIGEMAARDYSIDDVLPEISKDDSNSSSLIVKLQEELRILESARQKVFDDYYLHHKLSEEQFNMLLHRYTQKEKEINNSMQKIPLPNKKGYGDYDDIINHFSEAISGLSDEDKRKSVELLVDEIVPGAPTIVRFKWGETKEIYPKTSKRKVVFF